MKAVLWGKLIAIAFSYYKEKKKLRNDLICNIARLEKQHKQTGSASIYKVLQAERKKLEALEISKVQKILYLRQKYYMKSPKALKLLALKVRTKQMQAMIHAIKTTTGQKVTSTPAILDTFQDFYLSFYSSSKSRPSDINDYFNEVLPHKGLSLEHVQQLESLITPLEVAQIIKSMKSNKAPGTDGYGADFYKVYADLLAEPLSAQFNDILTREQLPHHGLQHQ